MSNPDFDLDEYLDFRDSTRINTMYIIKKLGTKITNLISNVKTIEICEKTTYAENSKNSDKIQYFKNKEYENDENEILEGNIAKTEFIYHDLLKMKKNLDDELVPSIFKNEDEWIRPENLEQLYFQDIGLFNAVPIMFKECLENVYLGFLRSGHAKYAKLPSGNALYKLHEEFSKECLHLRYKKRTHTYLMNKDGDWPRESTNEFAQFFVGSLNLFDSFRNFDAHKKNPKARDGFEFAQRVIKDPITGMDAPGNFIVIANNVINLYYQIIEIIQIWIDSKVIESSENNLRSKLIRDEIKVKNQKSERKKSVSDNIEENRLVEYNNKSIEKQYEIESIQMQMNHYKEMLKDELSKDVENELWNKLSDLETERNLIAIKDEKDQLEFFKKWYKNLNS